LAEILISSSRDMQLLHKVTVVSSLLFLVAMVSMSSIASNVYAAEPQFQNPRGVAVDSSGNVYVVDGGNNRIQKFSNTGVFIRMWGSHCDIFGGNECNGQFDQPRGIAVDSSGNVFVADSGNNRIEKFSNTGNFIRKWGSQGSGNGQFNHPDNVAVDSSGNAFVVDENNQRIQKFSSTGTFIRKWGSEGTGNGQFNCPEGIAVDKSGNVFVSDPCNDRIQKFSNTGTFIRKWGTLGSTSLSSASENLPNASGREQLNASGAPTNSSQITRSIHTQDEYSSEFPSVSATNSSQNTRSIDTQDETASEFH
jgi:DNA-binding beta-propeller fold protein YncE